MSLVMAYHDIKPNKIEVGRYYPAQVVENSDLKKHPDKMPLGRVRFRIEKLFEGIDDDLLPWAMPRFFRFAGGKNNGSFSVPEKKTKIFVVFETPDVYHAYYLPYPYTLKEQLELLVAKEDKEEYPKKHVLYSFTSGNLSWQNTDYKDPEQKDKKYIKNVGNVQYWFGKNFEWFVKDNFTLEVEDKFTTVATPDEYRHTIKVPHFFISQEDSDRRYEKIDKMMVFGKSFYTFADKAERHYAKGLLDVVSMGDYIIRLNGGNLEIFTDREVNIVGTSSVTVSGGEVVVQAAAKLKLVGSKITKNVEIEFESGETTMDNVEKMIDDKIAEYASKDN